jgi:antitoxin MazE
MYTQIGKWGNSLAVRIPITYARDMGLTEGMDLEVSVTEAGLIMRPRKEKLSLEELVAQITPENVHEETDWGPAIGRESW